MYMDTKHRPDLGNGYYQNPIMDGDYPDPSILRDGHDYYMTHSSGVYRPGLHIWHSRDLVNWEPVCSAIEQFDKNIWAPEIIKYKGKYYIYFAASETNWVTTAEFITGPWSKPVDLKIGLIDPGHCADLVGNRYMHLSDGYIVELAPDGLSVAGEPRKVYDGWQYPKEFNVEGFCLESPKIIYKDGYYYLTVAQGGTAGPATSHMIVSARSRTPYGPWENSPYNPIIHTSSKSEKWWARGHGTVIDSADGTWWMVYHAYEKDYLTLGRKTLLEPLEWTEDGWFRVPEGVKPDIPIKKLQGDKLPCDVKLSDNFTSGTKSAHWMYYSEYEPERYEYTGSSLIVRGKGKEPGAANPMTFITGDHAYEISVELELVDNAEGGILLFYNEQCFCGIGLSQTGIILYRYGKRKIRLPYIQRKIHFRLVNDHHDVIPYISADGIVWNKIDFVIETSTYNHNAFDHYLSLRPGIYSIGDGRIAFRNFTYKGID